MNKRIIVSMCIFIITSFFAATSVFANKADSASLINYASGSATSEVSDGVVMLNVNTAVGESGVARAKYALGESADEIYFSMKFKTNATDTSGFYPDRTVYLSPDTDDLSVLKKSAVLLCISGEDLLAGMDYTDLETVVSKNEEHLLCGAINTKNSTIRIWLDKAECQSAELNLSADFNNQDLCLVFENTYPTNKKKELFSEFSLYDVFLATSQKPQLSATTKDYTNYVIDIGTIATSADISIEGAGEYTYEFVGGGFNVTFLSPLDENEEYQVTVSDIRTLDGEVYTENIILNEKTYFFSLPEKSIYETDELSVFSVKADEGISKVTYYVDGKYFSCVATPFLVDLSGLSKGNHKISAAALADNGDLLTDKKSITIINTSTDTRVNYNFDDFQDGEIKVNDSGRVIGANDIYSNHTPENTKYMTCGEVEGHSKALVFGAESAESDSNAFLAACLSMANAKLVFESDIFFFDTDSSTNLVIRGNNQEGATVFLNNISFVPDNDKISINAYNLNSLSTVAQLDINKWYSISYEFDLVNQKYSFLLDGEKIADNFDFNIELKELYNMVRFHTYYKAGKTSKIALDNMSLSVINESVAVVPAIIERGSKVAAIPFSASIAELDTAPVVKKDNREIKISSWEMKSGALVINFERELMQTGIYSISVTPKSEKDMINGYFTVSDGSADIDDITIYSSEGKCSVEFTLNDKAGGEKLIYVVNRYRDEKLEDSYIIQSSDKIVSVEDILYEDGDLLKAFVLGTNPVATPFSDSIAQAVLLAK